MSTRFSRVANNFDEFAESGRTDSSEVVIIRANSVRKYGWLILLAAVSVAGCHAPVDSDLLDLHEIEDLRVEPGDRLSIRGAGFPAGHPADIRFEGVLHRPGASDHPVQLSVPGRAIAPDVVAIVVDDELIDALGGRGTFEGGVRIRFEAAEGNATVSGSLEDVRVDLLPRSRERMSSAAERGARARATASSFGLELAEARGHEGGVQVVAVRPGSPAMIAGVEAGDTIETIDGLQLASSDELIAASGVDVARLGVRKRGSSGRIERVLTTNAIPLVITASTGHDLWLILLLGGLSLFLLLSAPTARLTALVTREPRRRAGDLTWLSGASHVPEDSKLRRSVAGVFGGLATIALITGLSEIGRRLGAAHHVGVLLIAILSVQLVASLASRRGKLLTELLAFVASAVPLLLATAGAILLLAAEPEAGAAAPWRWPLFANPVALLLFVAFCVAGLGGLPADLEAARSSQWLARAHLILVACLGAPLFLGGLVPPLGAHQATPLVVGWLSLRSALLVILGGWLLRRLPSQSAERSRASLPFAFAGLCGSIAWLGWEGAAGVSAISGPLLSGVFLIVTIYLTIGGRRGHRPELRLHPFL